MRPDHMGPIEHQRDCPHGADRNHCRLCDLERENARLLSGMKREQARADMAEADKANLERELERYSMSAGEADQRMGESKAIRDALGFDRDADDVSPKDLLDALDRRDLRVAADEAARIARKFSMQAEQTGEDGDESARDALESACVFAAEEAERLRREADQS